MKPVSQVNLQEYSPLLYDSLKESTKKQLLKYWSDTCERLGLQYKFQPDGYLIDVSTLGTDYLIENVQWSPNMPEIDFDEDNGSNIFTLGELLDSREAETELFQLDINPVNVNKILMDKESGLAYGHPLLFPIELVHLPGSAQVVIGGGRHRLVALATLFKVVRNYRELQVYVHSVYPRSNREVAQYVEYSNVSRSMPAVEKKMLHSASSGENLTLTSKPEDFFERARQCSKVSELKTLAGRAWLSLLQDTPVGAKCTFDTIDAIGTSFMTKFCRGLNAIEKGTDSVLLLIETSPDTGEQQQVFEAITRNITGILVNNWNKYLDELRKPDLGRDRIQKEDENGNPLFKLEIKRDHGELAQMLADYMLQVVGEKLRGAFVKQQAEVAETKRVKKLTNKAKSLQADIDGINRSIQSLEDMGITVPADLLAQLKEKQALIRREIEGLGQAVVEPKSDTREVEELDSLLS